MMIPKSVDDIIDDLPPILYKYRIWDKKTHKNILLRQEVYFSPVEDFVDEYDCKFPIKFSTDYKELSAMLDQYPEWVLERFPFASDREKKKQRQINFLQGPLGLAHQRETFYRETNKILGILSLTGRTDNLAMWESDYAGDFFGFCIGFDPRVCLSTFINNQVGGGLCEYVPIETEPIKYVSSYAPDDEGIEFRFRVMMRKYDQYAYEEEYRLIKWFFPQLWPDGFSAKDRLLRLPKSAFREILVGYRMPLWKRNNIIAAAFAQQIIVPVYEVSPDGKGSVQKIRIW